MNWPRLLQDRARRVDSTLPLGFLSPPHSSFQVSPTALASKISKVVCVRIVNGFLTMLELCLCTRSARSFLAREWTRLVLESGT